MTIQDCICQIESIDDDTVIYAKRIDGKFSVMSDAVILELTDDEQELPTAEISEIKCPGFDYFLETFIIKEVLEGFTKYNPSATVLMKADRVVYYAEFDA